MGLVSDFFAATPEEVEKLNLRVGPQPPLLAVKARRVDPVKLVGLQSLVEGCSVDALLPGIDGLFVRSHSDDGPWVVSVPLTVVEALKAADQPRVAQLAAAWAATEEWVADGGTSENLLPFVAELADLARSAAPSRSLYVWNSL